MNLFVTGAVTSLLPTLVGLNTAREMLFLGQRYSAADLQRMGVAWQVAPDTELLHRAGEVARRLADLPTLSVRAMKRAINKGAVTNIRAALAEETESTVAGFMDPLTTKLLKDFG